jgi:CRP-like cAMP-binding protein
MKDDKGAKEPIDGLTAYLKRLPRDKWDELSGAVEHKTVPAHTRIFTQGDPGDKFYIVRSGKVRIFREDPDGLETDLSICEAGGAFGEMALLTGESRLASAEAMEETHLMLLSKEQFERILRSTPDASLAFAREISRRLLDIDKTIEKEERKRQKESRMSWRDFAMIVGLSVILAFVFNHSNPNGVSVFPKYPDRKAIGRVSPVKAMEEVRKGNAVIVDAGPEGFYQKKHIQGSISVPLPVFDILYDVTFRGDEKGKKVIVYGGTFSRLYDWELAEKLFRKGHGDVKVLDGGITAWEKAGYPVQVWEEKK